MMMQRNVQRRHISAATPDKCSDITQSSHYICTMSNIHIKISYKTKLQQYLTVK